ncbi:hypothetical protein KOR34_23510 [Posidoniimonas corsicana]|uniref:Lipoprotein n=1 Tax=Posidoniimonas corsicana TaxID=1938618 RepID=A0A5C5VH16_9BACT|nr:hypothetical protein [Posidoniimonas corsicana]TWT37401.1 hypothetical protein KOR34_23510 [Posidoniimonas corsicana]
MRKLAGVYRPALWAAGTLMLAGAASLGCRTEAVVTPLPTMSYMTDDVQYFAPGPGSRQPPAPTEDGAQPTAE